MRAAQNSWYVVHISDLATIEPRMSEILDRTKRIDGDWVWLNRCSRVETRGGRCSPYVEGYALDDLSGI